MTSQFGFLRAGVLGLSILAMSACKRGGASPPSVAPEAPANNGGPAPVLAAPPVPTPPVAPPPTANGPRAELTGEHHVFTATLAPPTAVPGDGSLTVELHGAAGYHVNNLYPVALDLQATNATAPAQLRRADVAQLTQEIASFRVPVHVTGGGATVTGTMRFAVCSAENCVPQSQAFAVSLPQ
ncbi:MAG: hypothetical protein WCJ30_03380 [Deltaproteobacteria bacterium]